MMKTKNLLGLLFSVTFLCFSRSYAGQCDMVKPFAPEFKEASIFLKDSLFALHLQLTNENFQSESAHQSRAKIFDIIFNSPYWSSKFSSNEDFKIFWNWIRFQFWGLLQQQALIKEDQGFKIMHDKNLAQGYRSILKFPIYPHPIAARTYNCSSTDRSAYRCKVKIIKIDTILSPALACDPSMDTESLTFSYYLTKGNMGWSFLDVKFKGRTLIADSFLEYDNLLNRYGKEKALGYLKLLINKVPFFDPQSKPENSGSLVFERNYKIKAPNYPLSY